MGLSPEEVRRIRPDDPRDVAGAASPCELLFWSVRRRRLPRFAESLGPRWRSLQHGRDVAAARLAKHASGPHEGFVPELAEELGRRYGADHVWSPSRLEAYGSCPFRFYAAVVLELDADEPPEPGPDARQLGSLLHEILEQAYRTASDPADASSVIVALQSTASAAFADAPVRYGFRPTAWWAMQQAELLVRLERTVAGLAEVSSDWVPVSCEAPFGMADKPALEVDVETDTVSLRGIIDRVDRNERGDIRVLDYKTGSSGLRAQDLVDGSRLQLPLYAMAARDALGMGAPADGLYWAILAAKAGGLVLARFEHQEGGRRLAGPTGAETVAREHLARIVAAVRRGEFPPRPPRAGCPVYCPAAAWCWRYEPGR